jgi:hypothetical protein
MYYCIYANPYVYLWSDIPRKTMRKIPFMKTRRLNCTYINGSLLLLIQLFFFLSAIAQPANDDCSNAIALTSGLTCTNIAGSLRNGAVSSTPTTGISAFCGDAGSPDVWYSFVAQSPFPTIRLSGMASRMDDAPRLQVFNTTSCVVGTLDVSSNGCASGTGVTTLNLIPSTGLTIGTTYLVRVFTNGTDVSAGNAGQWNFDICVIDVPPNDLCGAPTILTSSTSCVNTSGNMYGSTLTAATISAPNCATGITYDVWYRFVAQTTNPTITLSNIGVDFASPGMQLLSNNCGGTFTSYYCGTNSITANFLTPGNTYFIRVFSTSVTAPVSAVGAGFDICIVDPVSTAANDECTGAVNLSVGSSCSNINSNMAGATPSLTPLGGSCASPNAYDIWFKFTALTANQTVTLSSIGTNFLTPQIEMLSGACGSLSSVFCGASPLVATGLIPGNTYYVRAYSTTAPPPNGNARFNICVTNPDLPVVRFGNSYVNISKKTTGGVVEPGDTLEIRMTIHHSTPTTMTNLRFLDNVPTNTSMLTGAGDFLKVITNEGLSYKQYSLTAGDDAGTYIASPPVGETNIRMNLGFGASNPGIPANNTAAEFASATGTMAGGVDRPRGGGGLLFATAYRVIVTGSVGDTIKLNPSQFIYRAGGSDINLTGNSYQILISDPLTLCTNSIGVNNAAESGGTFGSGNTLNRSTDLTVPISGYSFMNNVNGYNGLGDGRYAIVNNLSPRSSTNRNANRRNSCGTLAFDDPFNCNNRMHGGFWYIDGDHTGTSNAIGNTPPSATANSGYMLMVNADYVASEVYSQTLNNLCPDTYYEFSAWFRNICPTCGVDSIGAQFTGTPTAPVAGYPGVFPNLSFSLNGLDYYSSGEIDTLGWQKKGFVFRTGPTQTSAIFAIRNNSQGGGGNDWVLDDISVATCTPNLNLVPNGNSQVCYNAQVDMSCDVISYFDNYVYHQWQVSHDNGATWVDTLAMGTGSPTPSGGNYVYNAQFPSFLADSAQHLVQYRIRVASSPANLYSGCSFYNSANIIVLVDNCQWVLKADLLSFKASLINKQAHLKWQTTNETAQTSFEVQKSINGTQFFTIETIQAVDNKNSYSFTDPETLNGFAYYRIIVKEPGAQKISNKEFLNTSDGSYGIISVVNPFSDILSFNLNSPQKTTATIVISDTYGKTVRSSKQLLVKGFNEVKVSELGSLAGGTYVLQVITSDGTTARKILKVSK